MADPSKIKRNNQYFSTLAATMAAFSMGSVLGYSSPAVPKLQDYHSNVPITSDEGSWVGSLMTLGALCAGPFAGYFVEKFGRKTTLILLSVPFVLGYLILAYANSVAMIYAGRIITGFCCGCCTVAAPTYIAEIADKEIRGMLGSSFQLMVTLGILFSYCVGATLSWEWLGGINAFLPVIFLILVLFAPESPTYLVSKDRDVEAHDALMSLRGKEYDVSSELADIQRSVEESRRYKASLSDLLKPHVIRPLVMSLCLMFMQQFSGINAVLFNTTQIFQAGGSSLDESIESIIIAAVQVAATLVATMVVDRSGRRILLVLSCGLMAVSIITLGVFFYLQVNDSDAADSISWLPLLSLIVFITAFSIGFGPIPWLMMGELFPPEVKGMASAIASSFNWACAFLVTRTFQPLLDAVGNAVVFWIYGGFCVGGVIYVLLFVYETKGRSLEEIRRHFGDSGGKTVSGQQEEAINLSELRADKLES